MDDAQIGYNQKAAEQIVKAIKSRRMAACYAETRDLARKAVLDRIFAGAVVYRCGSCTLRDIGVWEEVAKIDDVEVVDPFEKGIDKKEELSRRRKGLLADIMISSTNAITLDGKLVNLDGNGNRVAAMAFGPQKVILVVGMNKVVSNVEEGMQRIRRYAAPTNNIRLHFKNPCTETGYCSDCQSAGRICNIWSIIEGHMTKDRIEVILVGENLGY